MRHWYTRYRMSNALDRGTLAALLSVGHASRCPDCRAHARVLESLHALLSSGAPSAPRPPLAAARRPRWPLLVAAPALALAAAVVLSVGSARDPVVVVAPPAHERPAVHLGDVTERVSAMLARSETPLESELQNLVHDGRRGLDAVLATSGLNRRHVDSR
jgi:hypothetical protein